MSSNGGDRGKRDRAGLPTSFLLSAPANEDAALLRAGLGVEPLIRTTKGPAA